MYRAFGLLLLASVAIYGDALTCFKCESVLDDCNTGTCSDESCVTIKNTQYGAPYIKKTCAPSAKPGCTVTYDEEGQRVEECYCNDKSLCNGDPSKVPSFTLSCKQCLPKSSKCVECRGGTCYTGTIDNAGTHYELYGCGDKGVPGGVEHIPLTTGGEMVLTTCNEKDFCNGNIR